MSDLPIVAWMARRWYVAEHPHEMEGWGSWLRLTEEEVQRYRGRENLEIIAVTDHAAATASLASAQQRIEELERERDLTYRQWCGRDLMHLPLHEAVGARIAADAARAEELERLLRDCRKAMEYHPCVDWTHMMAAIDAACASDRNPQDGDANAAPGRSPESAVATATRPSEAFLRGIGPQSAWPWAQDDKGTK